MSGNAIEQSITALEGERTDLADRLGKVDEALVSLRRLVGTPVVPTDRPTDRPRSQPQRRAERTPAVSAGPDVRKTPAATATPRVSDVATATVQALSDQGPLSLSELVVATRRKAMVLKHAMQSMAANGIVHRTGTGPRNFKWNLGAKGAKSGKSTKEEPSRRRAHGFEEHVE